MQVHRDISQLPDFRNAVITIGSFDGVHIGHKAILRRLKEVARRHDGETVVITFHPHPRKFLGKGEIQLLQTLDEKIKSLEDLGIDHLVVVPFDSAFANQSPEEYVRRFLYDRFRPAAIVLGYDHRFGAGRKGDIHLLRKLLASRAVEVIQIPAEEINQIKVSSSKIRTALLHGDIRTANALLQRPYSLSGTVVHGNKIGKDLGFPTANIRINEPDKLIPADGVYAVVVHLNGKKYGGMLHIGNRPTINSVEQRLEVHIFDFQGQLYDKTITLDFIKRLRENQKFENLRALSDQLKKDEQIAREVLSKKNPFDKAAVVILNYNGLQHLKKYLPTVLQHTPPEVEVYVADNRSTDDSLLFLRQMQREYPALKVIELAQNYGFAGGYNQALKQVKADIFILLNSDVRVTENWTVPLLQAMKDPDLMVCQPKIRSDLEPDQFEYAGASGGFIDFLGYPFCRGRIFGITEEDHGQYDDEVEIFWATGAAMVIRSKLFWDFNGFDATFFAHSEEIDLCWQIRRAGYKIKVIPSSVVYHLGGGTLSYNTPNKVYLNFRNNLKMLVKNDRARNLAWKLPLRLILDGAAGFLFLTQGQFRLILSIIRAHFAFYACIPELIRRRRAIKQILIRLPNRRVKSPYGIYQGSIVWKYYAEGKRKYSQLGNEEMKKLRNEEIKE